MHTANQQRPVTLPPWLLVLLASLLGAPDAAPAQDEKPENLFAGSAPLKTDPELESQMRRAAKFAEDREYGYAATVWQYVLDKSGDTLMTNDGRTYTSLAEEVERTLTKLPPEGLRVYRITADGEAKAILAQADNEEDALSEVVRRYFVSSYGDDAAYRLGCIALDRYDFIGASRMFSKVLELHPDPSVPKSDLLLRLAVACARVGDKQSAVEIADEAEKSIAFGATDLLAAVRRDIDRVGSETPLASSTGDWRMPLGGSHRRGHMPALPPTVMSNTLTELWGFAFPATFSQDMAGQVYAGGLVDSFGGRASVRATSQGSQQAMQKWRGQAWRPAGQLLMSDGLAYFKTSNDLTAWKTSEIGRQAESEQHPNWRSAWLNQFQLDAASQMYAAMGVQQQMTQRPGNIAEVMLFGDRVHHAMSVIDDVIYNVEGPRTPRYGGTAPSTRVQQQPFQWGMVPRRTRKNWLAAYEARTGKALWYRSPTESDEENDAELGFLAAPVAYGRLLLIPVTDSGAIWMYALSREDGATVWKSYLCDEPTGGCAAWSPACVAIDGRDAYVVCGAGVVFALDAVSGQIRYAVRYERNGKQNPMMRQYGYGASNLMQLEGWDEDIVVPYGRTLVVMASDHNRLLAIDRRTGEFLWDSPRTPFTQEGQYCLGTVGRSYFVAGKNVVRRYDMPTGLVKWETEIEDSFGRGALTSDAIYVPVGNSIWQLDLEKGTIVKQVGVSLSTEDPVGNLYSDGERFWVQGGSRVYVLTNLTHRLALLEKRIAEGDPAALLDRMRLYAKAEEFPKAVLDLQAAHDLVREQQGPSEAAAALLAAVAEVNLAASRPRDVLRLVRANLGRLDAEKDAAVVVTRRRALMQAMSQIRQSQTKGAVDEILALSEMFDDDYLQRLARQSLTAIAAEGDGESLRDAVEGDEVVRRLIAADALAHVEGDAVKEQLKQMLAEDDPRLQLAALRALLNLRDREALPPLLKLMEAEDNGVRAQSVHLLRSATGQQFGYAAYDKPDARRQALDRWSAWLDAEGKTADIRHPLPDTALMLGRTLVASYGQNFIREFDASGKQTWSLQVNNPWACQGLPNGHRLVSLYAHNTVVEYDEKGEEVWRKAGLPGNCYSVQRLENGATLITCSDSNQVLEVDPEGKTVWSTSVQNRPMDAKRLPNGNTLVCCTNSNNVVEIDREGKTVWELKNMNQPIKAQRLENGNTLIVQSSSARVVEVDPGGAKVWEQTGLQQVYDAQRLPNGNTLIVDGKGVHEYSPQHEVVWEQSFNHGSGVSRY
ncbi:MAG: PQQ-binding-like beta-propeller repeat protein [Pirellulaceae bacterium]